ncbi:hypothetical protein [Aureimonas sp. SK2]|uniref:hypothetical protein n=1 Tax=Aureimonas sp. SK2 TaxID=3015992 RepID=UPI002443AB61|nr:hypothetical protein [Aureimonas sp. SK2]
MNAARFCGGLEAGIFNIVNASMQQRRQDAGGQQAVDMLADALRRERMAVAALRARVAELEGDLTMARETINSLV